MVSTIASTVTSSGCCAAACAPPPRPGAGGSAMLRQLMAGITTLLRGGAEAQGRAQLEQSGHDHHHHAVASRVEARLPSPRKETRELAAMAQRAASRRQPPPCPACTHRSGMLRTRWLNSLRADMVRPLAGWWVASRISWSEKLAISAAGRSRWVEWR